MSNLETILGGDDGIRRNFSKIEELYTQVAGLTTTVATLVTNAFGGSTSTSAPAQVFVTHSTTQNITTGTVTAVTWDTETYDIGAMHDPAVNPTRLTAPAAGLYSMGASVAWANNVTGIRQLFLRANGSGSISLLAVPAVAVTGVSQLAVSADFHLAAGEYVEAMVQQAAGGTIAVTPIGFWMHRVGSST